MTTEVSPRTKQDFRPLIKKLMERHQGRDSCITRRQIRSILGVTAGQDRQLRLAIGGLRMDGFPILFATEKPAGYYLPETLAELKTGMDAMRSYIIDECIVLSKIKHLGTQYVQGEMQKRLMKDSQGKLL